HDLTAIHLKGSSPIHREHAVASSHIVIRDDVTRQLLEAITVRGFDLRNHTPWGRALRIKKASTRQAYCTPGIQKRFHDRSSREGGGSNNKSGAWNIGLPHPRFYTSPATGVAETRQQKLCAAHGAMYIFTTKGDGNQWLPINKETR